MSYLNGFEFWRHFNWKTVYVNISIIFICPIIQQYAHLHRYNFRRAGQQGPTRTLTSALKWVMKQLLGTYSITQVKYYKREN